MIVVVFNPPFVCIEQILDFLSGFNNITSKLHILNDSGDAIPDEKENDLLILELGLSPSIGNMLIDYLRDIYPSLNTFSYCEKSDSNAYKDYPRSFEHPERKLSLRNQDFYLN